MVAKNGHNGQQICPKTKNMCAYSFIINRNLGI